MAEFKRQPTIWIVITMVIVSTLLSSCTAIVSTNAAQRANDTAAQLRTEITRRNADECVDDWDRTDGGRQGIAVSITGVVRVFTGVFPEADPQIVAAIEQSASDTIRVAQAQIPDPSCDLETAKRRLLELQGG